ncbi:MAG: DEAD/DEAH box helicase family protein [Bryobacteraceae bacterium]
MIYQAQSPKGNILAPQRAGNRHRSGGVAQQSPRLTEGERCFPWQSNLLAMFMAGEVPSALDIPTGLGKTAVIAIWLIARASGAPLPRRLVYVVDRRAVVDQATQVAVDLAANQKLLCTLGIDKLPISTLRGQFADNRRWLEDPALPAIIIGTVDMIGSRLLFEGYGVSRKMRPYQAGFLGADTLVILDEAHLVPPFEKLLRDIANGADTLGPSDPAFRTIVPPCKLCLSPPPAATQAAMPSDSLTPTLLPAPSPANASTQPNS